MWNAHVDVDKQRALLHPQVGVEKATIASTMETVALIEKTNDQVNKEGDIKSEDLL